jgi:hypothetical protein
VLLFGSVDARHPHHHDDEPQLFETLEPYESINENQLIVILDYILSSTILFEAHVDADTTVTKIAAIKNIKKVFTNKIFKKLDEDNFRHLAIFS